MFLFMCIGEENNENKSYKHKGRARGMVEEA